MCTAIVYRGQDSYFGRNLDLHFHYNEAVTITPRKYPFPWDSLYAMISIATVNTAKYIQMVALRVNGCFLGLLLDVVKFIPHSAKSYN